jgi:hypothetical protein
LPDLITTKLNKMKQKAEEIYHRFVNYEWNDVGEGLKKSILEAIETALKEGQKLPIHSVSNLLCGYFEPDNKTSSATKCKCGREKWEHPKAT